MAKIFDDKLTNRSILILETIMDAVDARNEINEILMCCIHAKLNGFAKREGIKERFGARAEMKHKELSFVLQIINGLASENELLRDKLDSNMTN
jgi:hypothetical protein